MLAKLMFVLVIGSGASNGSWVVIPGQYANLVQCQSAGEQARSLNFGLAYLSYTCVPSPDNNFGPNPQSIPDPRAKP